MKRNIFLLSFILISAFANAQYPLLQYLGSDSTLVISRGGFKARLINYAFTDTTEANTQRISQYPGAQIYTTSGSDKLWLRNLTATGWVAVGSGGGGDSGTVTSVGTGYGLSGGPITTSGTLLLDSATVANYFMRRKDSLTTSNALGYVTKTTLADTAAAIRALTSYITIDKRYDSLAWERNDSTLTIKSLRIQNNGVTVTPTVTDSSLSYDIIVSGGSQTLQQTTDLGNTTDTIIKSAGTISYETYGTVWTDNFARASLGSNYNNSAPSSTITFPSSAYMNLSGAAGATAWTNLISRTDSTNENKGTIRTQIVINTKSATSYGFAIGWDNLNTFCCNHKVLAGVTLTTGTNNLFFTTEVSNNVYTDATALTIASGDTIDLWVSQSDWTYRLNYYNYTTNVFHYFNITGIPQGSLLPATPNGFSRPVFVHLGGDMKVFNFSRISDESKYARNVFIGNSLTLGGNITDPSQRFPYIAVGGNHADVIVSAAGGTVGSYSNSTWTADLSRYAAGAAENFWLMVGGNDTLFSVWNASGKIAATQLRNRVVAAGKRFIWLTPMPRDATPIGAVADTIVSIATRYGDPYVDLYHRYEVGGGLPYPFDAGDGTHLTAEGNRIIGAYIDSLYPQYTTRNYTGDVKGYKGEFKYISLTGLLEWNYTAAAQSITIPRDVRELKINPSSTLATFTVTLPYDVAVGTEILITFGGTLTSGVVVTSFTLSPATDQTIVRQGFTTPMSSQYSFGVGDVILCRYQANGVWIASPNQNYASTDLYVNGHRIGRGNNASTQSNFVAGYFAGNTISSATSSTLVGNQAGQLISTGVRNTAVGANALAANSTGASNTAIGEEASGSGTKANNTAIGYAAGYNSTGTDNIMIGANTGFNISSGTFNTIIGSQSLTGITTGGKNTILGAQITGLTSSLSNNIIITDGDGNQSFRKIAGGQIGIGGVTAPTAWLQLPGGTATASTAPLKFTSGTNLTTAEAGAMEYNGTNLFFTRSGTTRENVLTTSAVNSVSPTSPNRTITVVIDGVTYYIAAKTTND